MLLICAIRSPLVDAADIFSCDLHQKLINLPRYTDGVSSRYSRLADRPGQGRNAPRGRHASVGGCTSFIFPKEVPPCENGKNN